MNQKFDAVHFFSSPKGRLNRQPYNFAFIIVFLLLLLFYAFILRSLNDVPNNTLSVVKQNAISLCTKESMLSGSNTSSPSDMKECVNDKVLEKLLELSPKSNVLLYIGYFLYTVLLVCPTIRRLQDRNKSGWWYLGFFIPLINIWLFIETSFLRGTVGPNDYGPDPIE